MSEYTRTMSIVTLFADSLMLAVASAFLFIILWHDSQKPLIRDFAVFLFFAIVWDAGSLLLQIGTLVTEDSVLTRWTISTLEFGFVGASVSLYIWVSVAVGVYNRRFRVAAWTGLFLVIVYRMIANKAGVQSIDESLSAQRLQPLAFACYVLFDALTLFLMWRYRRKIRSYGIQAGVILFLLGQGLLLVNPKLVLASFATTVSFMGVLVLGVALLQQEIITPLAERLSQIEAIHRVSLAVSSQLALGTVLDEIALQASGWLAADGVGIFLIDETTQNTLKPVAVHNLPRQLLDLTIPIGQGVVGTVVKERQTIYLENYSRDWVGQHDFSFSQETFGSVIATPLVYGDMIIGVLMVVTGRQGRLFDRHDEYLLGLLSAQAAVAISHSQLFKRQQSLTRQVEAGRSQLEAVLTSTENPVIAVNRSLELIFANPAAHELFPMTYNDNVTAIFPASVFPDDPKAVIRQIYRQGNYTYELDLQGKTYLCHIGSLGRAKVEGWVAVLNDVTQLKELDRMKSEMVRMASHDLKNPLMGALAYVDLLRDDLEEQDYTHAEGLLDLLERQLERMNRITQGVLDLERIKIEAHTSECCSPYTIVRNALSELEAVIAEREVTLHVQLDEGLSDFWGNCEQLERALVNLIENAIKFTPGAGDIHVAVSQDSEELIFKVQDNGVGIPEEIQHRVFDRFFRGRQKDIEHVTGSGLGLSLVKTIVERHKGRLWLESKEHHGTTMYVAIPLGLPTH